MRAAAVERIHNMRSIYYSCILYNITKIGVGQIRERTADHLLSKKHQHHDYTKVINSISDSDQNDSHIFSCSDEWISEYNHDWLVLGPIEYSSNRVSCCLFHTKIQHQSIIEYLSILLQRNIRNNNRNNFYQRQLRSSYGFVYSPNGDAIQLRGIAGPPGPPGFECLILLNSN
jgi:hypothetical protein